IPIGDGALPVGVDREPKLYDQILADLLEQRRFSGDEVVAELDGVLMVGDFVGVQSAVDMDERLGFARQRMRLLVRNTARHGEAPRDIFVVLDLRQVRRVGDEGDPPVALLRGLAYVDQFDAVGRCRDLAEVVERVFVSGELKVGARLIAEYRFGRRNSGGGRSQREDECERERLHGITASLYCSMRSSSLAALKSLVRRSTTN